MTRPPLCARRFDDNGLDDSAKQAVRAAWGDRGGYLYFGYEHTLNVG